ncbi:MAG: hypothetical protein WCK10_00290 [Candidatus Staskawiczbacteria bacterium]
MYKKIIDFTLHKKFSTLSGMSIIIIAAVIALGVVFGVKYYVDINNALLDNKAIILGGDRDEHGCIGSAGYSWCEVKNKCLRVWEETCELDPTADWKTYTNTQYGFEFKYPALLALGEKDGAILLNHSVSYKHPDACDFKGDNPPLDKIADFGVSIEFFNQNLKEMVQSTEYPGWDYVSANSFKLGVLDGYKIMQGIEGCGDYVYYFTVSPTKTMVIKRSLVTEFIAPIGNTSEYLAVPGVIPPDKEETYFKQMLSTFKFTK